VVKNENYRDGINGVPDHASLVLSSTAGKPVFKSMVDVPSSASSLFATNNHIAELPIVSFPHLKISRTRSGSADWNRSVSATSSSESITDVRFVGTGTYGVPSLLAFGALNDFCKKQAKPFCDDQILRDLLSSVVGDKIYDKCAPYAIFWGHCLWVGDKSKAEYILKVELGIVTRVYLADEIVTDFSNARDVGGKLDPLAGLEKGNQDAKNPNPRQSSSGSVDDSESQAITFDRVKYSHPIAFGFNSVRLVSEP
jgi:hypothetical protein